MPRNLDPQGLPRSFGQASHGVLVGAPFKRLITSPQSGARTDGTFAEGVEAQLEQSIDHVLTLLSAAGLEVRDLVRIAIHTKIPGSASACATIRDKKLAPGRPTASYREVAGFADPDCLVEVEAEAVREG